MRKADEKPDTVPAGKELTAWKAGHGGGETSLSQLMGADGYARGEDGSRRSEFTANAKSAGGRWGSRRSRRSRHKNQEPAVRDSEAGLQAGDRSQVSMTF